MLAVTPRADSHGPQSVEIFGARGKAWQDIT